MFIHDTSDAVTIATAYVFIHNHFASEIDYSTCGQVIYRMTSPVIRCSGDVLISAGAAAVETAWQRVEARCVGVGSAVEPV